MEAVELLGQQLVCFSVTLGPRVEIMTFAPKLNDHISGPPEMPPIPQLEPQK